MTKEVLHTRDATVADTEEIIKMQRQLAEYCGYDMREFGITEERIASTIENPEYERYDIAEDENLSIAAMMHSSKSPMSFSGKRGVYIEDLYTNDYYRGSGAATLLLSRACQRALKYADGDAGRAFLRLDIAAHNNTPTLAFYQGRGFEVPGHNTNLRLSGIALSSLAAVEPISVCENVRYLHQMDDTKSTPSI